MTSWVVQILPIPIPTLRASAPASIRILAYLKIKILFQKYSIKRIESKINIKKENLEKYEKLLKF